MRVLFYIIITIFILPLSANAESPKQKIVDEMVKVTQIDKLMDQTMQALMTSMLNQEKLKNPNISDENIKLATKIMREEFAPLKNETIAFTAKFMMDNFTADELKVILAYNKSSAGQKALKLMPQMMVQLQTITRSRIPEFANKFKTRYEQELEKSKK